MIRSIAVVAALLAVTSTHRPALAWVNDRNANRIDDRIERVNAIGIRAAWQDDDPGRKQMFGVNAGPVTTFPVRVRYASHPAAGDAASLAATGVPWTHAYGCIPYLRTEATFAQIEAIAALPGVTRIEVIPILYPSNHVATRVVRARDSRGYLEAQNDALFPSARQALGLDGRGIVIAIFDTGVNDAADLVTSYPGHESLRGKFLGGGEFFWGNPVLNTQPGQSMNPQDHGADASQYHATHVAGIAMGSGGPSGELAGVAPAARLVDCKVLSDAGASVSGVPEAVDWCLYNRDTLWPGLSGADEIFRGIDVINMSLGDVLSSDGTEGDALAVNAAVRGGLTVVCASGNLGLQDWIASPGSADSSICVGASLHSKSLDRSDDKVTSFSQEGPRADDGDAVHGDEMKPNVVAPGDGIVSADGDPETDGTHYKPLTGTSMASPMVAGGVALLLQANPALTPLEVRAILQNTAEHDLPSEKGDRPNDPFALDPNYDPGCGWGLIDLYAAGKEALASAAGVQVTQMTKPVARVADGAVDLGWITQREFPFQGFEVHRAPDAGGAPGSFTRINATLVPPSAGGDPLILGDDNRTWYAYTDSDPALAPGTTYWYRVAWVDPASAVHAEPALPVVYAEFARVATLYYAITHDSPDGDLAVVLGTSATRNPAAAEFSTFGPGVAAQDSFQIAEIDFFYVPPGHIRHFWSVPLTTAQGVTGYLPPGPAHPWFLQVTEGGFADQFGRIESFSMFVNDSPGSESGTTYVTNSTTPQVTVHGASTTLWIPDPPPTTGVVASFSARAEPGGVRLDLVLGAPAPGATAQVFRSTSTDFATREPIAAPTRIEGTTFSYLDAGAAPGVRYAYWVVVAEPGGESFVAGPVSGTSTIAAGVWLAPARPNPMTRGGELRYRVGAGAADVSLALIDLQGRVVRELAAGRRDPGEHAVRWDGTDRAGRALPAGLYLVRLRVGNETRVGRISVVD
jgi:subtilisin family serine protease